MRRMPDDYAALVRRIAAIERRLAAMLRFGAVAAVRQEPDYRVRVDVGGAGRPVLTDWLPVMLPRASAALTVLSVLDAGEGVLVVNPGGDAGGVVLPALPRAGVMRPVSEFRASTHAGGRGPAPDLSSATLVLIGEGGGVELRADLARLRVEGDVEAGPHDDRIALRGHVHVYRAPSGGTPANTSTSKPG